MTTIIPVLLYHRVSDAAERDPFAVSEARFRDHVTAIAASGRTAMTISALAAGLRGLTPLPERPVAITFDDGYEDTVRAAEHVSELGFSATVYVTAGGIGAGERIRSDQIKTLAANAAIELGAHTVSHIRLDELDMAGAHQEIVQSKLTLEDIVDQPVHTFAYPHGAYDAQARRLVIEAGFSSASAVKNAVSHGADDPWAIARWTVRHRTTARDIEAVLSGDQAPLAWSHVRFRTKAFRFVRRARRLVSARLV